MAIKATEISDLIKQRIESFKGVTEARNVGTIVSVTDGITRIHGLADVRYGESFQRVLPQVVGWRYFPAAKGKPPFCTCKFCTRGEYGARRLRERLGD